ncbi:hypothetical protein SAMN02745164_00750 [Marinitoga hydrogenitolerans DSM 16785]|uniref:Uncharacterized protein n=1 Tax=Marinitoga hydrogenitolerans (strain DSM 16785 / JCM 12826 / AT1271) TaxID=1122195 RepID=A0A1M4URL6_MARH1|nr:hypothetical protein [Marinitoga hydrogenitolerans]SHE59308.1 hypothetical protein SAMN02745164_00750 [Marinitoga hydrogenitolerans DSM 16785]
MKILILYGFGIGVVDIRSIKKVIDRYEKVIVFTSKAPQGKAKEMLKELHGVEINETLNFYKEAKKKAKEIKDSELKDLGDFGDRAMMRDPC